VGSSSTTSTEPRLDMPAIVGGARPLHNPRADVFTFSSDKDV
jgi:hypothetical protein